MRLRRKLPGRPKKWTNYTAFGMEMPGRSVGQDYKYGMNGQMKEGETFEGAYSAEFWGYDSRLGRRWEMDPVVKPWESPYACFANNPVYYNDIKGDEATGHGDKGKGKVTPVDNTPPKMEGYIADEVTVKPPTVFEKVMSVFTHPVRMWWTVFKNTDEWLDSWRNKSDHTKSRHTTLSGLEPTSSGPNKNVAVSSNQAGIEKTDPIYPGAIIMGKGGGVQPKMEFAKSLREALDVFKETNYGGVAGTDATDGINSNLNGEKPALGPPDSTEVIYQIEGRPNLVRVPTNPVDPKHVDRVIETGPSKGKVKRVISNDL